MNTIKLSKKEIKKLENGIFKRLSLNSQQKKQLIERIARLKKSAKTRRHAVNIDIDGENLKWNKLEVELWPKKIEELLI